MIARYTLPEMGKIWSEEHKFETWLRVELAACEAWREEGVIPRDAVARIQKKARFSLDRIEEIERETRHDLIAFVTAVGESVGKDSRHLHLGLTSYDVEDTALGLRLRASCDLIIKKLEDLETLLGEEAVRYRRVPMVGRTHGVHAEPITWGVKMALWMAEVRRHLERMRETRKIVNYGKISGAVGTYAYCPPQIEAYVCRKLGLEPSPVSTQILQRDRHAQYVVTLALVGSSLEKFAVEIRNLQRTEIGEVEEAFGRGQKGSSAMPHKKNPIVSERITGLARVVRANAQAAMESIALWHERDLSNSSLERVILPDSSILVDYMLAKFTDIIKNLVVHPENMKRNLEKTRGLVFSQRVLLELTRKGLSREEAYRLVQARAMESHREDKDFRKALLADPEITKHLTPEEIENCFDLDYALRHIDHIYERLGLEGSRCG